MLVGVGCDDDGSPGATQGGTEGATESSGPPTSSASASATASATTASGTTAGTSTTTPSASETGTATTGDATDSGSSGELPTTSDDTSTTSADACDNGVQDEDEADVDCGGACSPCPTGSACDEPADCETETCETGSCLGPARGCNPDDVQGQPGGIGWADSYSVDGRCYCASSFDHNIGGIEVDTPAGSRTVMEVCEAIGPGPGIEGNPIFNDIQCGNGPANDAGDEDWCPGRVDQGEAGCCVAGPRWDLSVFER